MADGYFERCEIYWCRIDHNVGVEMGLTRPAVIVSKTENNNKLDCVEIAWLTSKPKQGQNFVNTMATGRESWIIAQQVYTVDKSRFGKYMGKLTYHEQRALDAALEDGFDLGYSDTEALAEKDREIADRDAVIERLTKQIEDLNAEKKMLADLRAKQDASTVVELEKTMRLYHAALDRLVSHTLEEDLKAGVAAARAVWNTVPRNVVETVPPVVEEDELPVVPQGTPEENEDKVDINHCTITRLKKLGFTLAMARQIVKYRPFTGVDDMKKRVPGLKATHFRIVEPKLCCTPIAEITAQPKASIFVKDEPDPGYETDEPEQPKEIPVETDTEPETEEVVAAAPEKVNLNRDSGREIMRALACGKDQAYSISAYRNKNGKFTSVDDILQCPRITKRWLERYRDRLEV